MQATAGIPTKYRSRRYRSRLEARWAAFFDLLGWRYEYEPFDLNGWIPDFVLIGEKDLLVEVKPTSEFPVETARKIDSADYLPRVLILGCIIPVRPYSPWIRSNSPAWGMDIFRGSVGWYRQDDPLIKAIPPDPQAWHTACFWRQPSIRDPLRVFAIPEPEFLGVEDVLSGDYFCEWEDRPAAGLDEILSLWAEAGNRVQWKTPTF